MVSSVCSKLTRCDNMNSQRTVSLTLLAALAVLLAVLAIFSGFGDSTRQAAATTATSWEIDNIASTQNTQQSSAAALTFALHHAEQSMLNNNMNPQLAFEGVLAAIRSPFQKLDSGSGFLRQ